MPNKLFAVAFFFVTVILSCEKDNTSQIASSNLPDSNQVAIIDTDSSIAHLNTPLLAGNHNWKGYFQFLCAGMAYFPYQYFGDTSFNIHVLNDSTLSAHNYTLKRVYRYGNFPEDSSTYLFYVDSFASTNYAYMPAIVFKHSVDSVYFFRLQDNCNRRMYITTL